jgi:hypothetical protein
MGFAANLFRYEEPRMDCMICGAAMSFYFRKHFGEYGLNDVDYWLCPRCGFSASKTHFDMTVAEWEALNLAFHTAHNKRQDNPYNRRQRYFHQAQMLYLMQRHGLIESNQWLDWGSGEGDVSVQLKEHFGLVLENFDQYIQPFINPVNETELKKKRASCDLVLSTAVFEHIRSRQLLDEIESFVAETGCFAVHTLVREEIPKDPQWMYLLPVHCAFHTNTSMQILMDTWGYTCSVYNEHAKMWILFRQKNLGRIQDSVSRLNKIMGWEYLHYKEGFMDYWP